MDYFNLRLETIKIPAEAEEKAKRGYSWKEFPVKGIMLEVDYAKGERPAYCRAGGDNADGLKYIFKMNLTDSDGKALEPMTKALKKLGHDSWVNYLCDAINKNPTFAESDSETVFLVDWQGRSVHIWTTDKSEYPLLLEVLSEAIVKIAPTPTAKFDKAAGKAVVDTKGLTAFVNLIGENMEAATHYENLSASVSAIMEKWSSKELFPLLAVLSCVEGFAPSLKELIVKHKIDVHFQNNPKDHEEFFLSLQESMNDDYTRGWRGLSTKEYLCKYIKLLANALEIFGYGVYPKGIETIIRLFENDVAHGIYIETYKTATDYNAEDFGYHDSIENEKYYNKL